MTSTFHTKLIHFGRFIAVEIIENLLSSNLHVRGAQLQTFALCMIIVIVQRSLNDPCRSLSNTGKNCFQVWW